MPTNDFLPLGTGGGANVQSQATYAAEPLRPVGNQPGVAVSAFNNKALRQSTYMVAALAQFLCNITGDNVLDDANQANLLATMAKVFTKSPTITKLTAGAGTYTPPAGCQWLRIRMVGGGAGGSGSALDGGNGGDTTFGLHTASGAVKATGGSFTIGAGAIGFGVPGASAGPAMAASWGGKGGGTPFGEGAPGGNNVIPYTSPATPTNSGAGGGGSNGTAGTAGFGGGGGGFLDLIIPAALAANYAYAVGAGGNFGFTSTNGSAGAAGLIVIEEHYN